MTCCAKFNSLVCGRCSTLRIMSPGLGYILNTPSTAVRSRDECIKIYIYCTQVYIHNLLHARIESPLCARVRILEGAQWNLNNLITCEMHCAAKHYLYEHMRGDGRCKKAASLVAVICRLAKVKVGALKNY